MLTAVMVDSQMANCSRFGYQQAIPHSPFIASTSKSTCLVGRKEKKKPSSGLAKPSQASTSLSRQMHQWLGSRKTSHPHTKGILDKNCLSCGQPFRDYSNMKLLVFKSKVKLTVQTLLPCGRKKGLFGHVVAKSRKA
jgi:hypothetical protein